MSSPWPCARPRNEHRACCRLSDSSCAVGYQRTGRHSPRSTPTPRSCVTCLVLCRASRAMPGWIGSKPSSSGTAWPIGSRGTRGWPLHRHDRIDPRPVRPPLRAQRRRVPAWSEVQAASHRTIRPPLLPTAQASSTSTPRYRAVLSAQRAPAGSAPPGDCQSACGSARPLADGSCPCRRRPGSTRSPQPSRLRGRHTGACRC